MYRRDYFLKLVQQFTKVLEKLMGLKEKGDIQQAEQLIHEAYIGLFNLNRATLLNISDHQFIEKMKKDNKLKEEQLEVLAKLFFQDAEIIEGDEKNNLYTKSLLIFEYLNKEQKMYSFEREDLILQLKQRLIL
jgi:hypothetical protein